MGFRFCFLDIFPEFGVFGCESLLRKHLGSHSALPATSFATHSILPLWCIVSSTILVLLPASDSSPVPLSLYPISSELDLGVGVAHDFDQALPA